LLQLTERALSTRNRRRHGRSHGDSFRRRKTPGDERSNSDATQSWEGTAYDRGPQRQGRQTDFSIEGHQPRAGNNRRAKAYPALKTLRKGLNGPCHLGADPQPQTLGASLAQKNPAWTRFRPRLRGAGTAALGKATLPSSECSRGIGPLLPSFDFNTRRCDTHSPTASPRPIVYNSGGKEKVSTPR
jgi:hypothetical protein